jgi:chromosome segregation ATPase
MLRMEDNTPQSLGRENPAVRSAAALRNLEQRAQAALTASREHVSRLEADITRQLEQIAATLHEQNEAEAAGSAEVAQLKAEVERLQSEAQTAISAWDQERAALQSDRDDLTRQVQRLEIEHRQTKEEWQKQLEQFENKLGDHQATWNEQRAAQTKERDALERERDELRQKFELALQDVQRYRGRIGELEQELSRRPETNEADSAELVALRAERAALAERVEELERQPASQSDSASEQQMADLQRRFELAVEDVRELKTKNARLEAQLASAGKQSAPATDSGSMDWESQKRRLLASLEDSGDAHADPVPPKERATIESTIEMTDAIVAEKDHEIAALKSQLAAAATAASPIADEEQDERTLELIDADEIVAAHRKRVAQLEREMEDKLRTAELEISVERAKIARQKSELEDLRAELQSQRHAYAEHGGDPASGGPRRRWLSKLGLSGEEQ